MTKGGALSAPPLVVALRVASQFEQRIHVRHRLDRYGARAWLNDDTARPEVLADAMLEAIGSKPSYRALHARLRGPRRRQDRRAPRTRGSAAHIRHCTGLEAQRCP
jgi:hypothetical protein